MPLPALAAAALGSPVIGGIVNGISSIFTNKSNADINREQREWQAQQNDLQRKWQAGENSLDRGQQNYWNQKSLDWQEKMWNLQNQYNTPSAMMQRYKEANLNPYLAQATGNAVGSAPASSAGSPSISSSPAGSPSGMGSVPSAIPMQSPRFEVLDALGVSANVANQSANTLKTKWDIYNSILENGDRQTAKRFLGANPDMLSNADPENSIYYKRWKRQDRAFELENNIKDMQDHLLTRFGDQEHLKALQEADARIENIVSQMNERDANIGLMTEQMKTELEKRFNLHASGVESYANAETINQMRQWLVNELVFKTGLAAYTYQREKATFDSEEELRNWFSSPEGKQAIKEMESNGVFRNTHQWLSYIYDILDHLPFAAGAHVNKTIK